MPETQRILSPILRPAAIRLAILAVLLLNAATGLQSQPVSINPPVLQSFGNFGYAVAGFGPDRFLTTAWQLDSGSISSTGEAYLHSVSGARLATFTNPLPVNGAFMGNSIASIGNDHIIVAASEQTRAILTNSGMSTNTFTNTGEVYLYRTNGSLLRSVTNPASQSFAFFGDSVAGFGSDRLLIGAGGADSGVNIAVGKAYLYGTNGMLLTNFNNPVVADFSSFGYALAMVSPNRVLISAFGADEGSVIGSGRAYLFTTNGGAPVTTFVNPNPSELASFGYAIATLDASRVIIGAYGVTRSNFPVAGEAYLFNTNGMRLMTFTNPAPTTNSAFGGTVAAVGTNLVLIGADGAARGGVVGVGEAYLFATNGTLLATYTNPAPAGLDQFGWSVAAVGSNRIVIGAPQVDSLAGGYVNAGKAYLYAPTGPVSTNVTLALATNGPDLLLNWVAPDAFVLQETTNLSSPVVWADSTNIIVINGNTNLVPTSPTEGPPARFHRLRRL